jgi:hypothetical protein
MSADFIQSLAFNLFAMALESTRANLSPTEMLRLFVASFSEIKVGAPVISICFTVNNDDQPSKYEPAPKIINVVAITKAFFGALNPLAEFIR